MSNITCFFFHKREKRKKKKRKKKKNLEISAAQLKGEEHGDRVEHDVAYAKGHRRRREGKACRGA